MIHFFIITPLCMCVYIYIYTYTCVFSDKGLEKNMYLCKRCKHTQLIVNVEESGMTAGGRGEKYSFGISLLLWSFMGWAGHLTFIILFWWKKCVPKTWTTVFCINGNWWHKYQTLTDHSSHTYSWVKWAVCVSLKGSPIFSYVSTKIVAFSQ